MTNEASPVVSLQTALENVDNLHSTSPHDQQPCIEALSLSLHFRAIFDTNFEDKNAFVTSVAKYKEQASGQAELNLLLEEGEIYAVMLYTWRCCSRTVPQVKSNSQENREEIYRQTVEVLQPLIDKLFQFMAFQTKAIDLFCEEIKKLCLVAKNGFISEAYLLTLGKLLNMFAVLNELTNMKSSVNNDFSVYKRAAQFLSPTSDQREFQMASMNLATQNKIRDTLKSKLATIQGFEEILAEVVNICVMMYERDMYLEPNEKHMLVKVMAFGLFMMDSPPSGPNIYRMHEKKKINLSKIDKILKQLEMVPLYGDMMIAPYAFIKNGPNFDASKWPSCESSHPSPQSNILGSLEQIRQTHMQYVSQLARITNQAATLSPGSVKSDVENKELADLALKGLTLMSKWTQQVMELVSWKLMNPTKPENNKECPKEAEEYERATRYNYTTEEKFAIVEIIAMIKGLQLLMARMETLFTTAIRGHIYSELQMFVQIFLREPLRKAVSKKKDILKFIIMSIRETCSDWYDDTEPRNDPALAGKKDPPDGFQIKVKRRNVGPSSTQLYMVRTMLESLIDERSGAKKNLRKDHVAPIEEFHRKSFFWNYLLNYNTSLFNCGDLSQLWYREFFLEMTMGRRIQFPIEMSMPWLLTDHILETQEASMMEYIFYPLDLYNDSAQYALMRFKKRFLYDEVEAELNLCFDQLVYKLSNQIFAYFKHLAGCLMLDRKFRTECNSHGIKINFPVPNRYQTLLKQRHIQLLGRSIDLNSLISSRVNELMLKSLETAITRFEEVEDLTAILELEGLIEVNRHTYKLLSEYLVLNDFDAMFKEANNNVTAPHGRITLRVFWLLNIDFLPNYCYNSSTNRFVKSILKRLSGDRKDKPPNFPAQFVWGSKDLNRSFSTIYSLYSGFIGTPHFRSISKLLNYQGIAIVVEELLKTIGVSLSETMLNDVEILIDALPPVCKLPWFSYGSPGVFGFYKLNLESFMQIPNLKTDVFESFTIIGNTVIFCLLLEQAMNHEEIRDLNQAAPFLNIFPRPYVPKEPKDGGMTLEEAVEQQKLKYAPFHAAAIIEKQGTKEQKLLIREAEEITSKRFCTMGSMFDNVLQRIQTFLTNKVWHGGPPSNGVMNVDACNEFHRLWSAIQWVYCIPGRENEFTVEEMFGEGLNWAGCVLITLLGQQRRFEALDFSYHLLKVNRHDMKDDPVTNLKKMVDRIRKFQILNNQIFAVLNLHLTPDGNSRVLLPLDQVQRFQPPVPPRMQSKA
ncbi:cytoplasmic FMR1-interacting protein 1 homolog isoform X1 [Biomphalaria glabrata]|uniref:Cytoplasmic FMR1-interacting protein n=3 Tax=Biomphalaria glabrata TaxID=6526 RepID=A0A9U8ELR5_BIOGL|nr:cytoplasmic FMR1-interacting protein 1 homolog isoform X1 [Biomphalaria glabrata]XP_013092820.2 cytoplasmic FMR1-interacting protein 1 homolog isoform X1 [Biomphalaria glabrata]XP_055893676.1 cytoplasmic FMR1-interacting protein 1 homolog isoform X1 [Biomphalaria glabrata]XP_055893677.1 cytoplasmic FMR1-interacting protein 1 homolog isoform X1 [Biomphalaria glabrata]XP_055893678.1 cytoplasmic FMR1-interacting protein 1 homolog isoform X1 [Biomphalaria glabrata]